MRFDKHPILSFERRKKVTIYLEDEPVEAYEGETIAAALHAVGRASLSESVRFHRPRGLYCAIGKCSSCVMEVDGVSNVRTCMEPVREGMRIQPQHLAEVGPTRAGRGITPPREVHTDLAIVGGGPAGLSAAIYAARHGLKPLIIEENFLVGGQLIKQTHKFFGSRSHYASVRGVDIAKVLIDEAKEQNVEIWTSASVVGYYPGNELAVVVGGRYCRVVAKTILVATGASEKMAAFPGNEFPGVYGAGAIQTLMNVYGIAPGKRVLMVGAGNIGVIVAYQLLQAGVDVAAVCEAAPRVGAYLVHSAKLRRLGVPILTGHSISRVWGGERVEGAEIVAVDKNWQPVPGSEKVFDVDTVGLAVGLSPSVELLAQAGAGMAYVPELGGHVAIHDGNMETTLPGVYVAGDISGIEEASAAMMEGRIAGLSAAEKVKGLSEEIRLQKEEVSRELGELRDGPFGEKVRQGNARMAEEARKHGMR